MTSSQVACRLWAPCPPRRGSLVAFVRYQLAFSWRRKAPREPVTSTSFSWSGPLYWFRSGSTSGSYNCCRSLWLVTHTHTHMHAHSPSHASSSTVRWPLLFSFSVGPEEAGGPLWPEGLCRAHSHLVVGGAGEAWPWARGRPAAWTNQRRGSVPAAYRHQGNVSDWPPGAAAAGAVLIPHIPAHTPFLFHLYILLDVDVVYSSLSTFKGHQWLSSTVWLLIFEGQDYWFPAVQILEHKVLKYSAIFFKLCP